MGSIIKTLTKSRKTSSKGKPSDTRLVFKVINQFDPELQQLISSYLLKGRKRAWIEETCNINFKLEGVKREMYLSSSTSTRSNIDLKTFPFQYRRDLDCSLASIYEQRKGRPCKQSREQPDDITLRKKIRQSDVEFPSPAIIEEKLQPPTG